MAPLIVPSGAMNRIAAVSFVLLLVACSDSESSTNTLPATSDSGSASQTNDASVAPDASTFVSPIPINTTSALEAWLKGGEYLSWPCEAAPHAARSGSAHSKNRICSNTTLSADNGSGEYALGSVAVKELYDSSDAINGYAVSVKVASGNGSNGWYWYERIGDSVVANGKGVTTCTACHSGAPRDHVFTQVN